MVHEICQFQLTRLTQMNVIGAWSFHNQSIITILFLVFGCMRAMMLEGEA